MGTPFEPPSLVDTQPQQGALAIEREPGYASGTASETGRIDQLNQYDRSAPLQAPRSSVGGSPTTSLRRRLIRQQTQLTMLRAHNRDLKDIAVAAMSARTASIVVGGPAITQEDRRIDFRGNVNLRNSGPIAAGGERNQLVEASAETAMNRLQLHDLLEELQETLAATPVLSEEDRSLAREKAEDVAKAAARPLDGALRKAGRTALFALKGLSTNLPDVAKIVEAVEGILGAASSFKS